MYNPKSCVSNSSYTPWWILFIHTHSDQHDMKMTVNIGFCDVASFTWVMGLCHWGASVSYRHISSLYTYRMIIFKTVEWLYYNFLFLKLQLHVWTSFTSIKVPLELKFLSLTSINATILDLGRKRKQRKVKRYSDSLTQCYDVRCNIGRYYLYRHYFPYCSVNLIHCYTIN